jgi:hypothetical protein
MSTSTDVTTDLVRGYYDSWQNGIATFDEQRLRSMLAPDLLFEGPIAGTRVGADPFLRGLADFARSIKTLRMLQQVYTANEAAALYDCDVGATSGTLRFAEFMRVENERIQSIKLVYDPTEFRRLTA